VSHDVLSCYLILLVPRLAQQPSMHSKGRRKAEARNATDGENGRWNAKTAQYGGAGPSLARVARKMFNYFLQTALKFQRALP
jgi:hypothetical protein